MDKDQKDDGFSSQEAQRRFDSALKQMLSTPRKPHKPIGKKTKRARKRAASAKRGNA